MFIVGRLLSCVWGRVTESCPVSEGISVFVCQRHIAGLRAAPTFITSPPQRNTHTHVRGWVEPPATTCFVQHSPSLVAGFLCSEVILRNPRDSTRVRLCVQSLFSACVQPRVSLSFFFSFLFSMWPSKCVCNGSHSVLEFLDLLRVYMCVFGCHITEYSQGV